MGEDVMDGDHLSMLIAWDRWAVEFSEGPEFFPVFDLF